MLNRSSNRLAFLDATMQPCPLCGGDAFERLATQDRTLLGLSTVGCRRCGLLQTNPRPSAAGLDVFYRDHYRIYYQGASSPDAKYIADLNKEVRLGRTTGYFFDELGLPRDGAVLDYGCGEGSLFAALRKAGFTGRLYGVEPNAAFGAYASQLGNAVVTTELGDHEPVDLLVINHVLEHLPDPVGTLQRLRSSLKPEGRLYIDVPDAEEYGRIDDLHIAHIFHFTTRTLRRLVEQAGFRVQRVEKHSPPFHPRSVRLVASTDASSGTTPTSPETEAAAWQAVRRSGRFIKTMKLRLRRIPGARQAYRFAKGLVGRAAPRSKAP